MRALVHTPRLLRRAPRWLPAVAVGLCLWLLAKGERSPLEHPRWLLTVAAALLLAAFIRSMAIRVKRARLGSSKRLVEDFELGGISLAAAYGVVASVGAFLFPLVYLLAAVLVSFLPWKSALGILAI